MFLNVETYDRYDTCRLEKKAANVQFVVDYRSRIIQFIIRYPSSRVADGSRVLSSRLGLSWLHCLRDTCSARLCLKIISTDEVWRAEGRDVSGGGEKNRRLGDTTYSAR